MASKKAKKRRTRKARIIPGESPGTLTAPPSALPGSLEIIAYGPDQIFHKENAQPSDARNCLGAYAVTWVRVTGMGNMDTLKELGEIFSIHRLALEDSLSDSLRPRYEEFEKHSFVSLRAARYEEDFSTEQISLVFGDGFVVTLSESPAPIFAPLVARIQRGRSLTRSKGADFLAYAVLDSVIDHYFPVLDRLTDELEQLEERVWQESVEEFTELLRRFRLKVQSFHRRVLPLKEMFNKILTNEGECFTESVRPYLKDCQDHVLQALDQLEGFRVTSSDLMNLYHSTLAGKTNEVIKVLTIISTIFIPLSFIASVYGMNFHTDASPWNMPELAWKYGYPAALGVMSLVAGGLLLFFIRRGWIRLPWT